MPVNITDNQILSFNAQFQIYSLEDVTSRKQNAIRYDIRGGFTGSAGAMKIVLAGEGQALVWGPTLPFPFPISPFPYTPLPSPPVPSLPAPAPRGGFWRLSLPSALLKPPQILKRATKI